MYPIPPNEHLIENKVCKHCQVSFPITDKDLEFYDKVSPTFGGKKYQIPTPTLCPDCRQQRRLSFRNERKLYKRKCDATGKEIVSIYSPDKPYTVYHQDYWWGDGWDPVSYGKGFDLGRSAMEQMDDLVEKVPAMAVTVQKSENCDFTNDTGDSKDCYMSFRTHYSESILYTYRGSHSSNCTDCYQIKKSEHLYECNECNECFDSRYLYYCKNVQRSQYLWNCVGCSDCLLCHNLTNKKYHIFNKEYPEQEYEKKLKEFLENSHIHKKVEQDFFKQILQTPKSSLSNFSSDNSIGDGLMGSNNCIYCFGVKNSENMRYSWDNVDYASSMDCYSGGNSQWNYETTASGRGSRNNFVVRTVDCSNLYYSTFCFQAQYCFLCTGLRNKSYCILNKQYTKEEYEELVPRIIEKMIENGEWGEFFPASLSPFGYNETVAQEYFPLTRDSVIARLEPAPLQNGEAIQVSGTLDRHTPLHSVRDDDTTETFLHGSTFNWSDYEAPFPKVEKIIPASRLPESIESIPDDILNWAIECEVSGKPFRIIKQELEFYRKHHLPIPRRHPDQRHLDRMKMRNPRKLFERVCDCTECEENWKAKRTDTEIEDSKEFTELFALNPRTGKSGKKMITTYAPERPEIVYCEECYEREVMG